MDRDDLGETAINLRIRMRRLPRLLTFTCALLFLAYGDSLIGANNPCPQNWRWVWSYGPFCEWWPDVVANPPYKVNERITVSADTPQWANGLQVYVDVNECILTNRGSRSVAPSPVNRWTLRYGVEPVDVHSGGGLTASFTATNPCNVTVIFCSSNYNNSLLPAQVAFDSRSVSFPIYGLIHQTEADCPDDPFTRTTLGVGEAVTLYIEPNPVSVTWVLAGVGALSLQNGNPTVFSALDRPGNATITATTSDHN